MNRIVFAFVALVCVSAHAGNVASSPQSVQPLLLSNHLPDVAVRTMDGKATTLASVVAGEPAVLGGEAAEVTKVGHALEASRPLHT